MKVDYFYQEVILQNLQNKELKTLQMSQKSI